MRCSCIRLLFTLLPIVGGVAAEAPSPDPFTVSSGAAGQVFAATTGQVRIELAETGTWTSATVTVRDEDGQALSAQPIVAGRPAEITLPHPGFYQLTATATAADGAVITHESGALVLGDLADVPAIPATSGGSAAFGFFSVATNHPLAARAGGRWNRAFYDTSSIQRTASGFVWGYRSGAEHEWLAGEGLVLPSDQQWIICMGRLPAWLAPKPATAPADEKWKTYPPLDWDAYAKLVTFFVRSLPPEVMHLEITNEPDAGFRGTDEELVRYHTVAAEAAHAARPGIQVLGPCLCSVKLDVLQRLAGLGLFEHLDGLSIHPYVNGTAPEGEFIHKLDALCAWVAARPGPRLPIYLTEFGWQTGNAGDWQVPVDALTQARYVARAALLIAARPAITAQETFCLLNARGPTSWDQFSLLHWDSTPRRSYATIATAMHRLAGATAIRDLELDQGVHALLFARGAVAGMALWSADEPRAVQMPAVVTASWSSCGKPLTPVAGVCQISADPQYIEGDAALAAATTMPALIVNAGEVTRLPFTTLLASARVVAQAADGSWSVRADAPRGTWTLLGRTSTGWALLPVTVQPPVAASGAVAWIGTVPVWRVELASRLAFATQVALTLAVAGSPDERSAVITLAAGATQTVDLPLSRLPFGARLGGSCRIDVTGAQGFTWRDETRFHPTITAISAVTGASPDWSRIPPHEFTTWAPFSGPGKAIPQPPPGLRAWVRLAHSAQGLHVQLEVTDAEHRQNQEPAAMWREDSLQIAFDADADQPWLPNSSHWWNGHRVAEYGVALTPAGPRVWRWLSACGLPANSGESRIAAEITRSGDATHYELLFPWAVLGLDQAPAIGRELGLALAVNNGDAIQGQRDGLRLFYGVVEQKDATQFGRFTVLPPAK